MYQLADYPEEFQQAYVQHSKFRDGRFQIHPQLAFNLSKTHLEMGQLVKSGEVIFVNEAQVPAIFSKIFTNPTYWEAAVAVNDILIELRDSQHIYLNKLEPAGKLMRTHATAFIVRTSC